MLPFEGGRILSLGELIAQIQHAAEEQGIEGITFLGGEPVAHAAGAAALAKACWDMGLSVMVFSGYTLEQIRAMPNLAVGDLLDHTDILVDGPYLRELPENQRRWIGSSNQKIHFLTARYKPDDPCWRLPNTLELRWDGRELTVNGFPAREAAGLWRRD
jgi:anaerobic ribonucleoside-triphosphate reductase activating protein